MIVVVRQHKVLTCIELYAYIQLHTLPTPNPQPISHEPQYNSNPQSHVSHTSDATPSYTYANLYQETFYLTLAQENLFEPNTSFTQLLFAIFFTNLLDSQKFCVRY